jgi:hypothetical protein
MAEWDIELAVVADPYAVPPTDPRWRGDTVGSVAIVIGGGSAVPPLAFLEAGEGYVACQWGGRAVIGVYIPPSISLGGFEGRLEEMAGVVRRMHPGWVLVAGDFNAKSRDWGSSVTDTRGEMLGDWVAELGLHTLNRGFVPTFVGPRGSSVIDVTFGSAPAYEEVRGWAVSGEETLSDHRYIVMEISPPGHPRGMGAGGGGAGYSPPRWALKRLDGDMAYAAAVAKAWEAPPEEVDVEEEAAWFREAMTQICDASMPRRGARGPTKRRAVYWWSAEIAALREECNSARRRYTRARRWRNRDVEEEARRHDVYRGRRRSLQAAIAKAKSGAWGELLGTLEGDPWGRPYRIVRDKLRRVGPPTAETLEPGFLGEVVDTLFPADPAEEARPPVDPRVMEESPAWSEDLEISEEELNRAVDRMRRRNTAPGPDGIPGRVWSIALPVLGERLRQLFNGCLRYGKFPTLWKEAGLVLIPKAGKPPDDPSAQRPICVIPEEAKLLERVIAARLTSHMAEVGPDLERCQFGFRPRRSTVGAIRRLRSFADKAVSQGRVAMAISLDVANAFNSLPWEKIREGLRRKRIPPYLERVVWAYLSGRVVVCRDRDGGCIRRVVSRGVPQGSALGPILWDIGYDFVLALRPPAGVSLTCYADDTLVAVFGGDWREVWRRAVLGVELVLRRIRLLGLKVALAKTEAIWFGGPREKGPRRSHVMVEGTRVEVKSQMKYLGLILDSRWSFRPHFEWMATRLGPATMALSRLMPNLGGPSERVRRLYMGVVRSIAMYGAPVWCDALMASAANAKLLHREQRKMAIRVARAYRTVPWEAACVLAGSAPWAYEADVLTEMYEWKEALVRGGEPVTLDRMDAKRSLEKREMIRHWRERLPHARAGLRVTEAFGPQLEDWVGRGGGGLSFRTTQVLSGHGCFGEYLHEKVGREASTECHHCPEPRDTAQHTLEICPAWADERRALAAVVGDDLSLPALVARMLMGPDEWGAVTSFCDTVMSRKEEAERRREEAPDAPPERRRRGGRRRRVFLRQQAQGGDGVVP